MLKLSSFPVFDTATQPVPAPKVNTPALEKKKRTRRTKAQIEADKKAEAEKNAPTIEQIEAALTPTQDIGKTEIVAHGASQEVDSSDPAPWEDDSPVPLAQTGLSVKGSRWRLAGKDVDLIYENSDFYIFKKVAGVPQ